MILKDISSLSSDLEQMIKQEFVDKSKSLGENIKLEMQQNINTEVYQAYDPVFKDKRTYDLLNDIAISDTIDNGEEISFEVYDYAEHNGKYYPELVEHGEGYNGLTYDYPKEGKDPSRHTYLNKRPFMQSTVDEQEKNIQIYIDKNIIKSAINKLNNK